MFAAPICRVPAVNPALAKVSMKPVACPTCADGTLLHIEVEESTISHAKRYPVMIAMKCSKGHSLVIHVDARFQIRDVEQIAEGTSPKETAIDRTMRWADSL